MKKILWFLGIALLFTACFPKQTLPTKGTAQESHYIVVAYVTGWENNWGEYFEKANQVTHVNYAFANIKNGKVVEGDEGDAEDLNKLQVLKEINPDLKILISVGGWGWSGNFSDAVLTEASRQVFAQSAVDFMLRHQLDGIDLDWEYPGQRGAGNVYRPEDKENFTAVLKLLRTKLDSLSPEGAPYLLTIATGANQNYLDHTDMKTAHQYLDFINIMTYDFHEKKKKKTGHNANLYVSEYDDNERVISADIAVQQHILAGIPASKIILGVPFYGKWWKGVNLKNNGLYQPATGAAGGHNFRFIKDSLLTNNDFVQLWDSTAQIPYLWCEKDSQFVTYENPESIRQKAAFVKKHQLGGIMFWQYNGDDGTLLKAIDDHLK